MKNKNVSTISTNSFKRILNFNRLESKKCLSIIKKILRKTIIKKVLRKNIDNNALEEAINLAINSANNMKVAFENLKMKENGNI